MLSALTLGIQIASVRGLFQEPNTKSLNDKYIEQVDSPPFNDNFCETHNTAKKCDAVFNNKTMNTRIFHFAE